MTHPNQITVPGDIKAFVLGGKATFTIKSRKSDKHFTYRVDAAQDRQDFYFVKVASHGNDEFQYIGFIKDLYRPRVIKGNKGADPRSPSVRALDWYLDAVWSLNEARMEQAEFWHEGRCCACNRLLTDPASIERGIGPECAKKAL